MNQYVIIFIVGLVVSLIILTTPTDYKPGWEDSDE